ncbi:hypothetical protein [Runella sp.]|uniref:hypothetical protein n=1 Tax=Runella sp. TaxID=1960881 RepID=UPI003D0B6D21
MPTRSQLLNYITGIRNATPQDPVQTTEIADFLEGILNFITADSAIEINTASAIMELNSTNKALRLTRVNAEQMDNYPNPVSGLLLFNTTTSELYVYTGTAWESLLSV